MKRRVFAFGVMLALLFAINAQAIEHRAISGKPSLTFNGTTVHCLAFCSGAKNSDNVDATLTLYQNGRKLTSWSDSGKGSLTIIGDYAAAVSGKEYTLTLTYAIDGTKKPSVSVTAVCP